MCTLKTETQWKSGICKRAVVLICFCMDLVGQPQSAEVWVTQCYGLTYTVPGNAMLDVATLLITKTPSDRLFDQFYAGSYKQGTLFSFDYVKMKCLVKISLDSEFSTTSTESVRYKWRALLSWLFPRLMWMNICGALGHCFPMLHCIKNQRDKWAWPVQGIRTSSLFNHN